MKSNFSSSFTYEYDNQSDLWLGQKKFKNPTSYAYDGNSGNSTIYVKVSQEGVLSDFLYHKCCFEDNTYDWNFRLLLL